MLLFGGQLSGKKKEDVVAKDKVDDAEDDDDILMTPHSELIERLTDQEHRLLEELERTRGRLQKEWELKTDESSIEKDRESPNQALDVISKGRLRRSRKKKYQVLSQRQESALRTIRTEYDILPILTNKGDTPFEVGLDDGAHVLPVFKLPDIPLAVKRKRRGGVMNVTQEVEETSELTLADTGQNEVDLEEQEARQMFGLTDADLEDMGLSTAASTPKTTTVDLSTTSIMSSFKVKPKRKKIRSKGKIGHKLIRGKKSEAVDTGVLRRQLQESIANVQSYSKLVKDDLSEVRRMCPITNIRAELFMRKCGLAKIEEIFLRMQHSLMISAVDRWKNVVRWEIQQEKRDAYMQYRGTKKLGNFMKNWTKRNLITAWETWREAVYAEKRTELEKLGEISAIKIQNAWRGYQCREFAKLVREQQREATENEAAATIQAAFRGRHARMNVKKMVREMKENFMATRIQAAIRGKLARIRFLQMKDIIDQERAARKLQSIFRGRHARKRTQFIREELQMHKAATEVQRRYRGRLGRRKFAKIKECRDRNNAALKIQTRFRGNSARKQIHKFKREKALHEKKRENAALKIQAAYRGHTGRLSTHIKMGALRERRRMLNEAAIKIQTMYRGRNARATTIGMKLRQTRDMILASREWIEYWDEDSQAYFYYNAMTGEALWEPPAVGYTKMDGQLVLRNGTIMDDPGDLEQLGGDKAVDQPLENEETVVGEDGDILCVECEEIEASRHCEQCEDNFCDDCFDEKHAGGKRKHHTWKPMGPVRCMECEKSKATRWCVQCDDPYCMGCYQIIHAKGKKAAHEWSKMGHGRESNATYDAYLQSEDYAYTTQLESAEVEQQYVEEAAYPAEDTYPSEDTYPAQDTYDAGYTEDTYDESAYYEETGEAGEWQTAYDESGTPYYYNPATGETSWEMPSENYY